MVNRGSNRVKGKWLESTSSAVNNYFDKGLGEKAYKIIKQFFDTYKGKSKIPRGRDTKIIKENKGRIVVWKDCMQKPYRSISIDMSHKTLKVENGN